MLNGAGTTTLRDVDITVRVAANKLPTGTGSEIYFTALARQVSTGNRYRGVLRLTAAGAVVLQIQSEIGGTATTLGSTATVSGLTVAANGFVRLRFQVSGANPTTLRMRPPRPSRSRRDAVPC